MEDAATIELGPQGATAEQVVAVARDGARATLSAEARAAMEETADVVARLAASDEPAYGISTGFGSLAHTRIPADRRADLQRALVRSHAAGMGPPVEREVVRAMVFLRARSLAMGRSGARPVLAETMLAMLAAGLDPVVPEHGSLGASGDLAPLAHCALALIGEGEVFDASGDRVPAAAALAAAGIEPPELGPKEGLALINGTDGILGMLVLALADVDRLLRAADVAAAMSTEALLGTDRAFAADLIALRPQPGQAASAANLRRLLDGSAIVASHREGDSRVQDAYSVRCTPQVHGAARDTAAYVRSVAEAELRSAIDNPMVLPDGRVESCGNFHGAPVALACDFLAIAIADAGSISERRTDRLLDASRSHGLPPFMATDPGVDSGLMLSQYTQAAMVAENRRLAAPAAVDSLPTSAMQEDHVSMGWGAARKLRVAVDNLRRILAVELTAAARGVELRAPLEPAAGTGAGLGAVRAVVPGAGPDRWLAPELEAVDVLLRSDDLLDSVDDAVGAWYERGDPSVAEAFRRDGAVPIRGLLDDAQVETLRRGIERNRAEPGPLAQGHGAERELLRGLLQLGADRRVRGGDPRRRARAGRRRAHGQRRRAALPRPPAGQGGRQHRAQPVAPGPALLLRRRQAERVVLDPGRPGRAGEHARVRRGFAGPGTWYMPRTFISQTALVFDEGELENVPDIEADRSAHDILGWELEPGDAVAFHMLTLHQAGGSPTLRRAFSVRVLGDDATYAPRPHPTSPPFPGLDSELDAGDPFDAPRFPVLYAAEGARA